MGFIEVEALCHGWSVFAQLKTDFDFFWSHAYNTPTLNKIGCERSGFLATVLVAVFLSAAWICLGVFALLPTVLFAICGSFNRPQSAPRFPFVGFVLTMPILGLLLRLAYAADWLPFLEDWMRMLAEARPFRTRLANDLLAGERQAEIPYLMMLLGEVATAACVLLFATRPGMFANSVHSIIKGFAEYPEIKTMRLSVMFLVLTGLLCWVLVSVSIESRRIEWYSLFFPVFPFFACFFAAFGWQVLFASGASATTEQSET